MALHEISRWTFEKKHNISIVKKYLFQITYYKGRIVALSWKNLASNPLRDEGYVTSNGMLISPLNMMRWKGTHACGIPAKGP